MKTVMVSVSAALRDFVSRTQRGREIGVSYTGRMTVKDILESLGIPHVEIDLVLLNGRSVGFTAYIENGDRLEAYAADAPDIARMASHVRPPPPEEYRFVVDGNLGRLVQRLRLLGFDCLWSADWGDAYLARLAADEGRILLSRDIGLLKRSLVRRGQFVRSDEPDVQVREVIRRWTLWPGVRPFSRCLPCNGAFKKVSAEEVGSRLDSRTLQEFNEFYECSSCGKIYWKGSHFEKMMENLNVLAREFDPRGADGRVSDSLCRSGGGTCPSSAKPA